MKNLVKLQLRKSFLSFATILGAILVSVPLALAIKSKTMPPKEAVNLAMLFWAMAGIPLTALILSGIAGAEAAKETARDTEQPLPVSQYRLLLSSLAAVLLELAIIILPVWTMLGPVLPLPELNELQKLVLRTQIHYFYIFAIVYLSLYGFTLSYAFKNGIAGGALTGAAVAATVFVLISVSIAHYMSFSLIPLTQLKLAITVVTVGGGALALKRLSEISDRKVKRTASNISTVAFLLTAPTIISFAMLAWLHLANRKVTLPVTALDASVSFLGQNSYAFRDITEASRLMLIQKPFSGEVFFIDRTGNRSIIDPGRNTWKFSFPYLFPNLSFADAETISGPSGEKWVLYMPPAGRKRILHGNMKTGFIALSLGAAERSWNIHLLDGKEPGIIDRREDGYYYASLPPNGGFKWKKVSFTKDGYLSFLDERYYREGLAAALWKDGKTLEYHGKRWIIPGAMRPGRSIPGIELADGLNFVVLAKTPDGYVSHLCRPNGKTEIIQPDSCWHTPDGTVWGIKRIKAASINPSKTASFRTAFYILRGDGSVFSTIRTDRISEKTGITDLAITPLRARNGYFWFNAGDKYLVKCGTKDSVDLTIWRLPKIPVKSGWLARESSVSATPDGIFIAAVNGVYFMDWDGKKKKIY
jgi:hypothetical protein